MRRKTKDVICTRCYSEAKVRTVTPGSVWLELVLWLCFIVPGVIYSLIRLGRRHRACRVCGCREVVPADSAAAARLRQQRDEPASRGAELRRHPGDGLHLRGRPAA